MLIGLLLYINLCTASMDFDDSHRLRRQSPFLDGIQQTSVNKNEQRRTLSTNAHRKLEG